MSGGFLYFFLIKTFSLRPTILAVTIPYCYQSYKSLTLQRAAPSKIPGRPEILDGAALCYSFSNLAKSMLRRFLPCLPWNCTSTNSVSCTISLLRITPSPKVLWRTASPDLNCWLAGFAAGGGVAGALLFAGVGAGFDGMLDA